jgi:hypothetical protein
MGKISRHETFVDVQLDADDFFQYNTPLLPALHKYAWMMLRTKAPKLTEGMTASRLLVLDGKLVGRFYKSELEAQNDKDARHPPGV